MGGTFIPPPLSSDQGPDPNFTPPPLSSDEGPGKSFKPPPLSSHTGPDPAWKGDDTEKYEHPGPARPPLVQSPRFAEPSLTGQWDPKSGLWTNWWRGNLPDSGIPEQITNMPVKGVQQMITGAGRIAGSTKSPKDPVTGKPSTTGREIVGGVSDIVRGGGTAVAPFAIPVALATTPVATVVALGLGTVAGGSAEWLSKKAGLDPEYAALIGDTAGILAGSFGPKAVGALMIKMAGNPTGAVAELAKFADDHNIPISKALRTGMERLREWQYKTQRTKAAQASLERTQEGLTKTADQLRGGPPVTPQEAAEGAVKGVTTAKETYAAGARTAYEELEAVEKADEKDVIVGYKKVENMMRDAQGNKTYSYQPIIERMGLPVDIAKAKITLGSLVDSIEKQMPETERGTSIGLRALKNITESPDKVPASVLDDYLGSVKELLRTKSVKPRNRRLLRVALDELEPQLADAVKKGGGQKALDALQRGRELTKAKYEADKILEGMGTSWERVFPKEPVQLYQRFAKANDASINMLKRVQQHAPGAIPEIGQALLEGLFDTALGRGEKINPAAALKAWQAIGDRTKSTLFSAHQIAELDKFFELADKQGKLLKAPKTGILGGNVGIAYDVLSAVAPMATEWMFGGNVGQGAEISMGLLAAKGIATKVLPRMMAKSLWNDTAGINWQSPFRAGSAGGAAATASGRGAMSTMTGAAPAKTSEKPAATSPQPQPHAAIPKGEIVSEKNLSGMLKNASRDQHVDLGLMHAIQRTENAPRDPNAVSMDKHGNPVAHGLMQVTPKTFKHFARPDENINNPEDNVNVAARFLRYLTHDWKYKNDRRLVIAAYNAGPGAVEQYGGQVPPYPETQHYVRQVMANLPR